MYPGASSNQVGGADGDVRSQQTTPPLVFTTQFTGSPRVHDNSPSLEPLQVTNYNTVLGGYDSNLSSPVIPPRQSSTQLHVGDSPIRVTYRTRDGRQSPVLMQPVGGEMLIEPDALRGGGPYGYSISGRSSPIQASSPVGRVTGPTFPEMGPDLETHRSPAAPDASYGNDVQHSSAGAFAASHNSNGSNNADSNANAGPPALAGNSDSPPSASRTQSQLPANVVHRALHGRCRFVEFPTNLPSTETANAGGSSGAAGRVKHHHSSNSLASDGQSQMGVFIGQVRFETTPAELIWLVHRTSGACASHLESRGAGCYLLYCRSEADLQLVRSLHKRVLFDIGGVWLARTAEEVDALCEYVALDAPLLSRKAHLPRDSMVVEELKPDAQSHHASGGGRFGHGNSTGSSAPPQYNSVGAFRGGSMGRQQQQQQQQPPLPPPPPPGFPPMYSAATQHNGGGAVGMYGLPVYDAGSGVAGSANTLPPPPPPYQ